MCTHILITTTIIPALQFYYYNVELHLPTYYIPSLNFYQPWHFQPPTISWKEENQEGASSTNLLVKKSAAWAWYQHGSASDRRPICEFDVWRTKIDTKPSRYKLEAMNMVQETSNSAGSSPRSTTTSSRASNSLLDKYEIEKISRQLDYYIESTHANYHGGDPGGWRAEAVGAAEIKSKSGQKKKVSKGFWLRSHAVVCGSSRDEVVDSTGIEYSRRPGKGHVAVVEVVGFGPR